MMGALCHHGNCGKVLSVEVGFSNLTLEEWKRDYLSIRGMPNFVARCPIVVTEQKRLQIAKAEASGYDRLPGYRKGGHVGFKGVYRRSDSGDGYRSVEREGSSERRLQPSRDGETGRRRAAEASSSNSSVELAVHVDTITSVQNPYVKHLVKLRANTSYRNAAGYVVVVGSVPLREICEILTGENSGSFKPIKVLLVLEDTSPRADLSSWAERIVFVTEPVLRKVAGVDSTQGLHGVGLLTLPPSFRNLEGGGDIAVNWVSSPRRVLVLDGIQDPGNLGTLLRTAAAFAWDAVFVLPGGCDPFNEKALRASRGAAFRLPIAIGRWSQLQSFADMHKMKLYAADPDQKDTWPSSRSEHISHVVVYCYIFLIIKLQRRNWHLEGKFLTNVIEKLTVHRGCNREEDVGVHVRTHWRIREFVLWTWIAILVEFVLSYQIKTADPVTSKPCTLQPSKKDSHQSRPRDTSKALNLDAPPVRSVAKEIFQLLAVEHIHTCCSQSRRNGILSQRPSEVTPQVSAPRIPNLISDGGWVVISDPGQFLWLITVHAHCCGIIDNDSTSFIVSHNVAVDNRVPSAAGWRVYSDMSKTGEIPLPSVVGKS